MRRAVLILLLTPVFLASSVVGDEKEHYRTYTNDEFGFSFVYPVYESVDVQETGPDQRLLQDFQVVVSANKPIFSVHVLANPKNVGPKEFAYHRFESSFRTREEVGCEEMTVAGETAVRMTFFAGECATTQVFILHAGKIFLLKSWCCSGLFPEILPTFRFHARAGKG